MIGQILLIRAGALQTNRNGKNIEGRRKTSSDRLRDSNKGKDNLVRLRDSNQEKGKLDHLKNFSSRLA